MPPAAYAWSEGPATSRPIRILLYLAEGLVGGGLISVAGSMAILAFGASAGAVGLFAIFLVIAARWTAFFQYRSREETRWELREWIRVRRWPWTVLLVGLLGGALLSLQLRSLAWVILANLGINQGLLFTGFLGAGVAFRLSSKGEVDPETLTLSYGGRREVDLHYLTDVKRVTIGPWTLLWLSAPRGYEDRRTLKGLYVLPSETIGQVWHVFEAGLNADVETPEGYQPSRTVIYAGIGIIGGSGLAMFAALFASGKPIWFAGYLALTSFGLLGAIIIAAELGVL